MARLAYTQYNAEWVINNDADEFWWTRKGNLKDLFKGISTKNNVLEVSRTNFIYLTDDEGNAFFNKMIYREIESFNHSII
jgi:hypothetical protein